MKRKAKYTRCICNQKLLCKLPTCFHGQKHRPSFEVPKYPPPVAKPPKRFCTERKYLEKCLFSPLDNDRVCLILEED